MPTRGPRRVVAAIAAIAAAVALASLALAGTASAKEGMRATLTGTFPRDAAPGSLIDLVADVWVPDAYHARAPVFGSPIGIRLTDVHGAMTEAMGVELESERGRYRFEIAMPPGRVISVVAFIRGTYDLPIAFEPDPIGGPATSTEAPSPPPAEDAVPGLVPATAGLIAGIVDFIALGSRRGDRARSAQPAAM